MIQLFVAINLADFLSDCPKPDAAVAGTDTGGLD
jgi:hypothetical protein